jgi:hypothetical protein
MSLVLKPKSAQTTDTASVFGQPKAKDYRQHPHRAKSNQIKCFYIAFVHQLISQSAVQKPSLKPQTASNAGVEALKAGAAAFKERDTNLDAYKKSRYALRRTIKQAKRQYRIKIVS